MIWVSVQKSIGSALQNWDLHRRYPPILSHRVEGFTEEWGVEEDPNDTPERSTDAWQLVLVQFRPAWMEQLALRVAGAEFTLHNSNYAVTELTGPLPYLQSFSKELPAMVGRRQNSPFGGGGNAIFQYLQEQGMDLDTGLSEKQCRTRLVLETLVRERLHLCLAVLRYNDNDSWEQLYRPQLHKASKGASWQAWSERLFQRPHHCSWTLEDALSIASNAYAVLEERLQERTYLLGTREPTFLDCELFDHLMNAVTNVHLVVKVAEYPQLTLYLQRLWKRYFSVATTLIQINLANVFAAPLLLGDSSTPQPNGLIQELNPLACERIQQAGDIRRNELPAKKHDPLATWYHWTRGAGPAEQHQHNDEVWLATVVVSTVFLFLGMGFAT